VRSFEQSWNELTPRVNAWRTGNDPELILEYQQELERLIRTFHGDSRKSFAEAARLVEALDQGGSEMTRRRVVKGALSSRVMASLNARNDWTLAARAVVPRYNVELKTLRAAIRDLAPRIAEGKERHLKQLSQHLAKARAEEAAAQLQQAREQVEAAVSRHQTLSEQFLKVDSAAASSRQEAAAIQDLKERLRANGERQRELTLAGDTLRRDIQRLRESAKTATSGLTYQPLPAVRASLFDFDKRREATMLGAAVSLVFVLGVWLLSRPRTRPSRGT